MPGEPSTSAPVRKRFPLLRKRLCVVPTWRGWLLLFAIAALVGWIFVRNSYAFLAMNAPVSNGVLVVEGWAADHTLRAVLAEFHRGSYDKILVVGGPIDRGVLLSEYGTFAELGQAILIAEGAPKERVTAVPAPSVPQDRTYTAFLALNQYFQTNGQPASLHLFSEGAHARRSRLMLEMALSNDSSRLGVTSIPSQSFNPKRWWSNSPGFKHVLGESLSYVYARILFRPN